MLFNQTNHYFKRTILQHQQSLKRSNYFILSLNYVVLSKFLFIFASDTQNFKSASNKKQRQIPKVTAKKNKIDMQTNVKNVKKEKKLK